MENGGNNGINKRLDEIESLLKRVSVALLGDEFSNGKGYLKKIDTIDERVTKLEENQAAQRWFLFGSGITGGAGLVKVLEAFF